MNSTMFVRAIGGAVVLSMTGGCASTLGAFYNRPVVEDNAKMAVSTISLSADRRTVVVVTDGPNRGKFCAEPPPDTALSLSTELKADLEAAAKNAKLDANAKGSLEDKLETTVAVLAKRTTSLEGYRLGAYSLCQLHMIGALSNTEVAPAFELLTKSFFEALKEELRTSSREQPPESVSMR